MFIDQWYSILSSKNSSNSLGRFLIQSPSFLFISAIYQMVLFTKLYLLSEVSFAWTTIKVCYNSSSLHLNSTLFNFFKYIKTTNHMHCKNIVVTLSSISELASKCTKLVKITLIQKHYYTAEDNLLHHTEMYFMNVSITASDSLIPHQQWNTLLLLQVWKNKLHTFSNNSSMFRHSWLVMAPQSKDMMIQYSSELSTGTMEMEWVKKPKHKRLIIYT